MKAIKRTARFAGRWEEEPYTAIGIFKTLAKMSEVKDLKMLKEFPLMLSGTHLHNNCKL